MNQIEEGLYATSCWSPEDYKIVLNCLLSSEYHAVQVSEVSRKLGKCGKDIVAAMVRGNLLSYRPASCKRLTWSSQHPSHTSASCQERCLRYLLVYIWDSNLYIGRRMCRVLCMADFLVCQSSSPKAI